MNQCENFAPSSFLQIIRYIFHVIHAPTVALPPYYLPHLYFVLLFNTPFAIASSLKCMLTCTFCCLVIPARFFFFCIFPLKTKDDDKWELGKKSESSALGIGQKALCQEQSIFFRVNQIEQLTQFRSFTLICINGNFLTEWSFSSSV